MIEFYTGTPGSGKSYHLALRCFELLKYTNKNVIANFALNLDAMQLTSIGFLKRRITDLSKGKIIFRKYNSRPLKGNFFYWHNGEISPERLLEFAQQHHRKQAEGQTLVIIDEAGIMFNCRQFASADRQHWTDFFAKHRHYGFDFILACQFDRQVDRQIRMCVEYEVVHRKLKNYQFFGWLMAMAAGGNVFLARSFWYASRDKLAIKSRFMRYRFRIGSLYDTYAEFTRDGSDAAAAGVWGPSCEAAEPEAVPDSIREAPEPASLSALDKKFSCWKVIMEDGDIND